MQWNIYLIFREILKEIKIFEEIFKVNVINGFNSLHQSVYQVFCVSMIERSR